ncbi:leucine--tRNA ligase [Flavobacteriaceae bacterium]|nr:leucine--tRNA ligase [Flavobacteriaceae bacterium]MDB9989519.1 leucine--tRNA ligase [Flavobacteriaceae bacterium]MDB9993084.1 leucine--tRNA ligase [Flavobacteriaceae bacterium]
MSNYYFNKIEAKWQKYWAENQTFKAENLSEKPKYYVLDMFPYPSGAGLHVGHPLGYIASDIYARYKRHQGYNVLHPQGYDSFGLPAEQYAIQTGQHPAKTTTENIKRYREQLDKIGFSFDWSREVRTSDPQYYKWTQWIFIQLFESWYCKLHEQAFPISDLIDVFEEEGNIGLNAKCGNTQPDFSAAMWNSFSEEKKQKILLNYRLTYLAETEVNWCPQLGTVLANDEIVNGVSERGGFPVIKKKMTQWIMRISVFGERLLKGLETLDWSESLKETQRNWIGKSVGASVEFRLLDENEEFQGIAIKTFTTRPDTIFGVTFLTLAPEHELVDKITTIDQRIEVGEYITLSAKKTERERMADVKNITGVFTGAYAKHPLTKELIPIWIGDYVLAGYGTGAVMAVPCGDQRDYDFAKHFDIPIKNIFEGIDISEKAHSEKEGTIIANSDFINGLSYKEATYKVIQKLEKKHRGAKEINYRLRDAVFSRQRYWGEPFPVYYKDGLPQMIAAKYLPIRLPEVEKYLPTKTGEPPLGRADVWAWDTNSNKIVSNKYIDNIIIFPIELNTMPGWAGSSWYMFRYMDALNKDDFASKEAIDYWENVDLYIGGSEHATGHLLYSRFWVKFLKDRGFLSVEEPFKKLINQGMILGESAFVHRLEGENKLITSNQIEGLNTQPIHADISFVNNVNELNIEAFKNWRPEFKDAEFITEEDGTFKVSREVEKMSKSKYNVVNPDDICMQYGADTLRMYEMFLGPLEQAKPWSTAGITGVHSFLKKMWRLFHSGIDDSFLITDKPASKDNLKTLHKTIKKVIEDIENFSFNTSVSTFMIAVNELSSQKCNSKEVLAPLLVLLSPYAPHISEELWSKLGNKESISKTSFPKFEEIFLIEDVKKYPISFNGKMRFTLELPLSLSKDEIESVIMSHEKTIYYLEGKAPKKVIIVPGKIVNIVA